MLVVLRILTAAFAVLGSLNAISSFASLSFITIFGVISALAFTQRESWVTALVPAAGAVAPTAPLYHLYAAEQGVFVTVIALGVVVVGVEVLYFERELIEREFADLEEIAR